ncbi:MULTISPECIES: hypothetical protein [Acetobacteraceae]|jgi:lipopolysaccharide export LptBFGC system permease protein LptF|nr:MULTISPECIES: hypothetical protein [Acetobacteraceae]
MDDFTKAILLVALPFCIFTLVFGLVLGPIANRLAKYRESLR